MNKGVIRGLDPNAFALNKPGGVSIVSSDLNAVPLTITGENGQSASMISVLTFTGTSLYKFGTDGGLTLAGSNPRLISGNGVQILNNNGIVCQNDGLKWVNFVQTASAVNNFQITNSAASSAPILSVVGSDSAIDLTLTPKGTAYVNFGYAGIVVGGGATPPLLATAGIGQANQPTTAGQNSWLQVKINGTLSWIPIWV